MVDARELLYEGEPIKALPYYVAIGRMCVVWSQVESMISSMALISHQNFPQHRSKKKGKLLDAAPPEGVSGKITLIKKCIDDLYPSEESERHCALMDEIRELHDKRNTVLHANWIEIYTASQDEVHIHRIRSSAQSYKIIRHKATLDDVYDLTEKIDKKTTHLLGVFLQFSSLSNVRLKMR